MITTNKEGEIVEKINRLKWVGMDKDTLKRFSGDDKPWEYEITDLGFKYNMNDIAAGIGLEQLKKLDNMNNKRREVAKIYDGAFKNIPWLKIQPEKSYVKNAYWLYILRLEEGNRDDMMRHLLNNGILANTSFRPLHMFIFYKDYYQKKGIEVNCPVAEREWNKLFVLPLFPEMTPEEINKVINAVKSFR
jgi:perosamine synthetase